MLRFWPAFLMIPLVICVVIPQAGSEPTDPAPKTIQRGSSVARTDRYGDPLPEGAIARLGTVRFRNGHFIRTVAWSPDGKMLATCSPITGPITLWDAATGREIRRMAGGPGDSVIAWSPDGKVLASGYWESDDPIHLWDVSTGKEIHGIKHRHLAVDSLAWSPDGKILASGGSEATISLFDVRTGSELNRLGWLFGHRSHVEALAWSPDGKTLASGSSDQTIRLWDIATLNTPRARESRMWRLLSWSPLWESVAENRGRVLAREAGRVDSLAWSPDGKTLASVTDKETIRLRDVATGKEVLRLDSRWSAAWSPDGKTVAVGDLDGPISLWNPDTRKEVKKLDGEGGWSVAYSPDGKKLAGIRRGTICLWDLPSGKVITQREGHGDLVTSVSWSPDGKTLASGSQDGTLRLWNPRNGNEIRQMARKREHIHFVGWSPDGKTLTSGEETVARSAAPSENGIRLWNPATGKEIPRPGQFVGRIAGSVLSPDARKIAHGGGYNGICFTDVWSGKLIREFAIDDAQRLAWSPDCRYFAWSGWIDHPPEDRANYAIRVVELSSGRVLRKLPHVGKLTALAWSPDARTLVSAGSDSIIRLWDSASGRQIRLFRGHEEGVKCLAYSPDGKTLASGGYGDESIRLWEIATGKEVRRFDGVGYFCESLAWSPDGRRLASGCDSTILIWAIHDPSFEPAKRLGAADLKACWAALAGDDAARACQSIDTLIRAAGDSVPFLAEYLQPVAKRNLKHVSRLIAELDDDNFSIRQKANDELARLEEFAEPALRQARKTPLPLERHLRVERLLRKLDNWSGERLRALRSTTVLENIATPEARRILRSLAKGAPEARLTTEARASLARLARRGK